MGLFDIIDDFIDDPIGTTADITLQPVRDTIEIIDGLTEGEIREQAIIRLGTDAVIGMTTSELLTWYTTK